MTIVDVNLLLYAVNADAPSHQKAREWWEQTVSGTETIGLAWTVVLAFLRLTTRPGLFQKPLSIQEAFTIVEDWFTQPNVIAVEPGKRHLAIFCELLMPMGTGGNLTSDAHLAALALECGAQLCSSDQDFARFPGLRWMNPLA